MAAALSVLFDSGGCGGSKVSIVVAGVGSFGVVVRDDAENVLDLLAALNSPGTKVAAWELRASPRVVDEVGGFESGGNAWSWAEAVCCLRFHGFTAGIGAG